MQMGQQRQHVSRIGRHLVPRRVFEPIAFAAPCNIRANHANADRRRSPRLRHQSLRQHVKITPLARQPMPTQHDVRAVGLPPLLIGHAMDLCGVRAHYVIQAGLSHGAGNQKGLIEAS